MSLSQDAFTNAITLSLGLVIGSFLNVVVARLPQGKSLNKPGSHCPKCQAKIKPWNNIPVLSYLILRGKCPNCKNPISIRYPMIELLTGVLFLATKIKLGWSPVLFFHDFPFIALLIAITFIDLEHRIIPDPLSIGGTVLGLATGGFVRGLGWTDSFLGAAIGFGFFYILAWAYQKKTGRSGLGGGDIKLLAMLGAFLGPAGVFVTILFSSLMGSVIGITWGILEKRKGGKDLMTFAIPYGPFLVIGGLYYYLLSDVLWSPFMTPM